MGQFWRAPKLYLVEDPGEYITRLSTIGGAAVFQYRRPWGPWGTPSATGDLWFSPDGAVIFTAGGNAFLATDDSDTDLCYVGSLATSSRISSLAQSAESGTVVALREAPLDPWQPGDHELQLYDGASFALTAARPLPMLANDYALVQSRGRFTFVDTDGVTVYVLATVAGFHPRTVLWSTTLAAQP